MDIKAWLAEADEQNGDYDDTEDDREGDVAEFEFVIVFNEIGVDFEVGKGDNRQNKRELRDADAGRAESIDNQPAMSEPGDFGEDKAKNERDIGRIVAVSLDEDVMRGGVADNKFADNEDGRVGNRSENASGSTTNQNCD